MKNLISYVRKVVPHSSPIRLWYTRLKNFSGALMVPTDTKDLLLIGVTGTDGKTTTVEMVAHMLTELNIPHISASSYAIKLNGEVLSMSKRTTSSAYAVHKLIQKAQKEKVTVVVLEASSHSFVQWRLLGVMFDVATLTNITHEHLNFHKTIEHYAAAKKLLFTKYLKPNGTAILPTNDAYGKKWIAEFVGKSPKSPMSVYSNQLPYSPENLNTITDKYGTAWVYDGAQYQMPMLGGYNAGNAVAAALAVSALQIPTVSTDDALQALSTFEGIPGRMQLVPADNITCIVDFALTEKAMSNALETAREVAGGEDSQNKVIVVFGASGGQHDASVHPGLAKAAAEGADVCIVTDDEPYDGDPREIRANLIKHIEQANNKTDAQKLSSRTTKFESYDIADRREAIRKALSIASYGDVVIVTGMGHYTSRTIDGKEEPWNDAEVIKEELTRA